MAGSPSVRDQGAQSPPNPVAHEFTGSLDPRRAVLDARTAAVGQIPKDEIWRKNKSRLYRYRRATPAARQTPVLLLPSLINRAYILDLCPGVSLAEYLRDAGFDVFLYDWGDWGPEDHEVSIGELVTKYLTRAVYEAWRAAGHPLTLFGQCIGGTLWTCFAALYPQAPVQNLVLATTPIDFRESGELGKLTAKGCFPIESIRNTLPAFPGELISLGQRLLNPASGSVDPYARLGGALDQSSPDVREWQAIHRWRSEPKPFPVAAYHQWITDFYQENRLVSGSLVIGGRVVDLSNIKLPILNVAAMGDTIAVRPMTAALFDHVSSPDTAELLAEGDHIDAIISRPAKQRLWPHIVDWLVRHD